MDSQSQPLPRPTPQPQRPTPGSTSAGTGMRARATHPPTAKFPKPPPFLHRFIMLCLRPESWAEAARYRTAATLIPVIVAILVGTIPASWMETRNLLSEAKAFAARYEETGYPALELHPNGTISSKGPLTTPIRLELPGDRLILVDPTGTTTPDAIKTPALFVTDKDV
jgi:hypothetical protein